MYHNFCIGMEFLKQKQEDFLTLFEVGCIDLGSNPFVFLWPAGDWGDKPHPADAWLHVYLSRYYQREGERGPEDVLCKHWDVKVPFSEQLGILRSCLFLTRRMYLQEGTTHFLTSALALRLDVRALSHPLEPLQTSSCDPVAYCLVSACAQIVLPLALCLLLSRRRNHVLEGEHWKKWRRKRWSEHTFLRQ